MYKRGVQFVKQLQGSSEVRKEAVGGVILEKSLAAELLHFELVWKVPDHRVRCLRDIEVKTAVKLSSWGVWLVICRDSPA